jgi:beta-glucanase (GH16 family)
MLIKADQPNGCAPKATNASCIAPYQSYAEAIDPNATANVGTMGVRSGELITKYNNYRYGYYEARLSGPIANPGNQDNDAMSGAFLANLSLYRTPKNLAWQEIDFQLSANHHNSVNGNAVNAVNGALGWPAANAQSWTSAGGNGYAIYDEHTYAISLTSSGIDWILDGKVVHTWAGSQMDPLPTRPMKIWMNLWVFSGNAFGDGSLNKYPFQVSVDYFHFYKWDQEDTYPCSPTPGCMASEDKTKSSQNNPKEMSYGM